MDERIGSTHMKRIFTEPANPEELYEFFTYGLHLTPLDWRHRWCVNATVNTIRRRLWYARTLLHSESISVEYQAGSKESDASWYMNEWKYLTNVYK